MWKITSNSELTEIPTSDRKSNELVWIPIDEVVFFQPSMPLKSRKSWRQTIPFALEDSLIAPVEKIHFAFDQNATEQVSVIAISKNQLDSYLAATHAQQLKIQKIIPELYALPYTEEKLTIWHEGERCLIRDSYHSGHAGSVDWIASLISVYAHSRSLDIYSDNAQALPEAWQQTAQALPASLDEMMERGAPTYAINLLQGEYSSHHAASAYIKPWRMAIGLAAVAFAAHVALMFVDTQRYNVYADNARRQSIHLAQQLQIPADDTTNLRSHVVRYMDYLRSYSEQRQKNTWTLLLQIDRLISNCLLCRVEKIELRDASLILDISFTKTDDDFKETFENLSGFDIRSEQLPDTAAGRELIQFKLKETNPQSD